MNEEWVQIKECPNYAVSNQGRVLNIMRDTYVAQRETAEGFLRVSLFDKGRQKDFSVHHLVYQAFYGEIGPGVQIYHIDSDRFNNTPDNLRHRRRTRTFNPDAVPLESPKPFGTRHWGRQVRIVETNEVFRNARDVALHVKGDHSTIYACLRGERDSHKGYTYEYA